MIYRWKQQLAFTFSRSRSKVYYFYLIIQTYILFICKINVAM